MAVQKMGAGTFAITNLPIDILNTWNYLTSSLEVLPKGVYERPHSCDRCVVVEALLQARILLASILSGLAIPQNPRAQNQTMRSEMKQQNKAPDALRYN